MAKADALKIIQENIAKHERGEDARVLDLGNCGLRKFPEEALECVWVEELILSGEWTEYNLKNKEWKRKQSKNNVNPNKITSLPQSLPKQHLLQKLVLADLSISDLNPLTNLTNLQLLYCSNNQISDLSPLFNLTNLQLLDCSNNQISDLSPLSNLTNLQLLDCDDNQISDLNPLNRLIKLQHIGCNHTKVANLRPLAILTNLQHLGCANTQVADLSPLTNLTKLRWLLCSKTEIVDISPLAKLTKLDGFLCSRTQVADLSPLVNLTNLKRLDCDVTQVTDLSPLANLINLKRVSCSNTQINNLTPLAKLVNLRVFFFSNTQVTNFNPLTSLAKLEHLACDNTPILDITPLANLTSLKRLYCSNTQINDLTFLVNLINLQLLDCSNTQVTNLMPILFLIKKGIEIKWQNFSEYDDENSFFEEKQPVILLKECPLTNPPVEIVKQGNEAILQWLNSKNKRPTLEAKVMFIGDSGYGKTHLIELLRHGRFTRMINTTLGIERNRLEPAMSSFGSVRLNVWDLGGQEFMRSTHQFFFTTRTIYVLVTDARQGERREDMRHWLNLVKTLGEGAPVLIVINKIDTNDHDIDRERIKQEYPNVLGFVRTCIYDKSEKGLIAMDTIRELKQQIDELASDPKRMPSVFYEQREEWFTVKETLENTEDPYITIEAYRKLEFIRELPTAEQDSCLKQLNFVGSVVSYFDDARLSDTHVIDPKWIMDGVYAILNDFQVKDVNKGCFSFADMSRILSPEVYPKGKLVFLTDLMQKFRLCYPQRGSVDTFLLPDLFSDAEPAGIWKVENPLRFRFNYDTYPPDVFIAQFIAAKYRSIEDEKRWRGGVIICDAHCRALIRRSFSRDHIEIEVAGPERQRRGFLRVIREVFYELHEPYSTLKPLEEIPYKDKWLDYWDLLKAEADGDRTYRILGGERIVLSEVLDGYAVELDRYTVARLNDKLDRIIDLQDELMEINTQQLDLLLENQAARETYFQAIDQGLKQLLEKLPANHPIAQQANAYLNAADLKLKYKLGHKLLGGEVEAELNVDAKKIFRQMVKDAKRIVADFKAGHIFTKPR